VARRWRHLRLRRGAWLRTPVPVPVPPLPGGQIVSAAPAVARAALSVPGLLLPPAGTSPPASGVARSIGKVTAAASSRSGVT
jgi:hypothetical protein